MGGGGGGGQTLGRSEAHTTLDLGSDTIIKGLSGGWIAAIVGSVALAAVLIWTRKK